MLSMLKDYKGNIEINGKKYDSVKDALKSFVSDSGTIMIHLSSKRENARRTQMRANPEHLLKKITVKQYMTRPATDIFPFMREWNNNVPMPLRTMVGTVEKETHGMVYMKLHGDITAEKNFALS